MNVLVRISKKYTYINNTHIFLKWKKEIELNFKIE